MAWGFVNLNLGTINPALLKAALDNDLRSVANLGAALGGSINLGGDVTQAELGQIEGKRPT
jgi:hypothetical protein